MGLFIPAKKSQACLKCGILGFAGAGKTFTATLIAVGIAKRANIKTVYFIDTETGSDWVQPIIEKEGLSLMTVRTRAFADLVPAVKEAEAANAILIIDSISHFWTELTESYAKQKNRTRGLEFQDWAWLKKEWRKFTDVFLNSRVHILLCGRAGYEYDYFTTDGGKKELEKTGIKMKAETEMGYEPSLLVLMERSQILDKKGHPKTVRTATVLKDRADKLDGMVFSNPTFANFKPHFDFLEIGGEQKGIDTSRTSESMIEPPDRDFQHRAQQKTIWLDEIETLLTEFYPSRTKEDTTAKIAALKEQFGTGSWERIKTLEPDVLKKGFEAMAARLDAEREQDPVADIPVDPAPAV